MWLLTLGVPNWAIAHGLAAILAGLARELARAISAREISEPRKSARLIASSRASSHRAELHQARAIFPALLWLISRVENGGVNLVLIRTVFHTWPVYFPIYEKIENGTKTIVSIPIVFLHDHVLSWIKPIFISYLINLGSTQYTLVAKASYSQILRWQIIPLELGCHSSHRLSSITSVVKAQITPVVAIYVHQ